MCIATVTCGRKAGRQKICKPTFPWQWMRRPGECWSSIGIRQPLRNSRPARRKRSPRRSGFCVQATNSTSRESITMRYAIGTALIIFAALGSSGCATRPAANPAEMTAAGSDRIAGYLPVEAIPDSIALVPPPAAANSAAQAHDDEVSRASLALYGSARWALAAEDAALTFPAAAQAFSCALNAPVTSQGTPVLYRLLQRTLADAGRSTAPAKRRYLRPRPFVTNGKPICTPASVETLRTDGSYPSGHAAVGWAWALVLTEVAPERADAILARGRAFARSRVVCNVHWFSDTVEGSMMGAATVARLHAESAFRDDVAAARKELAAVRVNGSPVTRDCKAEAQALAE